MAFLPTFLTITYLLLNLNLILTWWIAFFMYISLSLFPFSNIVLFIIINGSFLIFLIFRFFFNDYHWNALAYNICWLIVKLRTASWIIGLRRTKVTRSLLIIYLFNIDFFYWWTVIIIMNYFGNVLRLPMNSLFITSYTFVFICC